VLPDAPIRQAKANFDKHAERICDPVIHVCAAVEGGCISSIMAPKVLAPINTGSRPNRPVRASGKARAAKAMKCTSLSPPSGTGGGASSGQCIAVVRTVVTATVRGMSRYLRIPSVYLRGAQGASLRIKIGYSHPTRNP
jgi:hypothetical protein